MRSICFFLPAPSAFSASRPSSFQAFPWAGAAPRLPSQGCARLSWLPPRPASCPRAAQQPASPLFPFITNAIFPGLLTKLHIFVWAQNLASRAGSRPRTALWFPVNLITAGGIIFPVEKLGSQMLSICHVCMAGAATVKGTPLLL